MGLKNTKTEENLKKALAGESIARNKYSYYAQAARANGDDAVADAFEEMARNEMAHARIWFELLYGKPGDTASCLMKSASGEYEEWYSMYPAFAAQARADGLEEIAQKFEHVAAIERNHDNRFMTLLSNLKKTDPAKSTLPAAPGKPEAPATRTKKSGYRCQFCGATFDSRPDVCRVCGAIGAFEYAEYYE